MIADADVLPNLLAVRAARDPERVFMHVVGGADVSFGELERAVAGWMAALRAHGVGAGDTVAVMLDNTEILPVWMAIARLGAVEVPVNTAYRGRFLEHVLVNSGARCAVTSARYAERFAGLDGALGECAAVLLMPGAPDAHIPDAEVTTARLDADGSAHGVAVAAHDTASILYTSGTTGASKGAIVSWEQVYRTAEACPPWHDLDGSDVRYSPFPMFHMSGKLAVYAAAVLGGRVVVRDVFSTSAFWADIDRYGCTTSILIGAVPAFLSKLEPGEHDHEHPLRNVLLAPPPEDPVAFCRRFGFRGSAVFNMTEISCPTSTGWDEDLLVRGSVGRVRSGYAVRIVDDHDRELAPGQLGEIVVRADEPWRLMGGYWKMPEKTVEAWRNLWFHTGDLGRMDPDGSLYYLDRKKDAIRRRGENISSMELEAEICEYEAVAEVAVVAARADVGEDEVRAVVVPVDRERFEPAALLAFLTERVPSFMLPRYVTVCDALPKTPTEKVLKHELKDWPLDVDTWDRAA